MIFRFSRRFLQAATGTISNAATSNAGTILNANPGPEKTGTAATESEGSRSNALYKSINHVTLVGVAHDVQSGFVYEDPVCQFTLSTSSLDTMINGRTNEAVLEKDHHTIRCFGEPFCTQVRQMIREGYVVVASGRLRLNPQMDPSTSKYHYFPYIHVSPPHGNVHVIHGDPKKGTGDLPDVSGNTAGSS
ncbi:MP18 RNA editing complex protein [Perkinsela sp. CCAP 1560/4]|nr:MP18 RNA editing complex protein [Perkinsela sp. CCAP 1560/4]|eukprot:KNH03802.1 MP18 RNA editing complex protein [Perkinsela sp. CCAP 1560/4]